MLFIVHLILETQGTFPLRRKLYDAGFTIYLCNNITGERSIFNESGAHENETVRFYTHESYVFECFYNDPAKFPPEEVLKAIADNPGVWNYTFERRRFE